MPFDLLIRGGRVIDPSAGFGGPMDVGIRDGRVAAVEGHLPEDDAAEVIDARGLYVTPGLIDLHAHVFHGVGYFGIDADSMAWRSGVTTWVDAGSAGAFTFPGFRESAIERSVARIRAWIAVSYVGMPGLNYDEYVNPAACDPVVLRRAVRADRDVIVGIKVRMGTGTTGWHGLTPLERAREASDGLGLPLMVHIAAGPPEVDDVLALLRHGDVLTHCCTGQTQRIVDAAGSIRDSALAARERGVIFDLGHGAGSFSWTSAEAFMRAGIWPDVLSSDLHSVSVHGPNLLDPLSQELVPRVRGDGTPAFSLPVAMSKFLHLGMPLADVVAAATTRPAEIIGMSGEIGTLRPGARADIATFTIDEGDFELLDVHGARRTAHAMLRNTRTIKDGHPMPEKPLPEPPSWIELIDRTG